jgi:hypothetical protein
MFLDMVNVVEKTFEFPLLQKEIWAPIQWSLKSFVCFCTWSEEDKIEFERYSYLLEASVAEVFFRG